MTIENHKNDTSLAIEVKDLTYEFPRSNSATSPKIGLQDINLSINWSNSVLLVGPNGSGKSTLLRILAGKTLIKKGQLKLGGFDPFEFSTKTKHHNSDINNYITYLGTEWITNSVIKRDIPVNLLLSSIGGDLYLARRNLLIEILDIDPSWSMINLSDGERRRVQIAMGLIKPWKLLLLDEVTIDLDVVVRSKLLNYLKNECNERNCTVVYATHIFDGLGNEWCDRLLHLNSGQIVNDVQMNKIKFESNLDKDVDEKDDNETIIIKKSSTLHPLALYWLNKDLEERGSREDEKLKMAKRHNDWKNSRDGHYFDANEDKLKTYFKNTRSDK
ncbi:CAF16 [Candida pseudojiufengensis]|uniref:CAF16 n=1 Tax=Candida pseudojiufengensis TaxID=497109 RepID=UPI002224A6D9|nr:CAF16 [Candida pseudojiufengensis]KAI5964840.1 CAF16 [Candida pseudojiufengensis]